MVFFHSNSGCTNATQCYVIRTVPLFFTSTADAPSRSSAADQMLSTVVLPPSYLYNWLHSGAKFFFLTAQTFPLCSLSRWFWRCLPACFWLNRLVYVTVKKERVLVHVQDLFLKHRRTWHLQNKFIFRKRLALQLRSVNGLLSFLLWGIDINGRQCQRTRSESRKVQHILWAFSRAQEPHGQIMALAWKYTYIWRYGLGLNMWYNVAMSVTNPVQELYYCWPF
jgi:hypothetical protein